MAVDNSVISTKQEVLQPICVEIQEWIREVLLTQSLVNT